MRLQLQQQQGDSWQLPSATKAGDIPEEITEARSEGRKIAENVLEKIRGIFGKPHETARQDSQGTERRGVSS